MSKCTYAMYHSSVEINTDLKVISTLYLYTGSSSNVSAFPVSQTDHHLWPNGTLWVHLHSSTLDR